MDSYSVRILATAVQELMASPFPFRRQINQRIMGLQREPRPKASSILDGDLRELTVSGWSVIYEVNDTGRLVTIVTIHRSET